jgi:hypothetical protein
MRKYILLLFMATFLVNSSIAQEKKSKKEIKLEKKKTKFEAQKKAMEIGQFGFAIRKMLSSNIKSSEFVAGIVYVRGDEGEFDEVTWYDTNGESIRLNADFVIENYYAVSSSNGQKMTASYEGVVRGVRYSFIIEIAFGEKPKLKIKSTSGTEIWHTGIFDVRN